MAVEAAADSNYSLVSGAHRLAVLINRVFGVRYVFFDCRGCGSKPACWCDHRIHWKSCVHVCNNLGLKAVKQVKRKRERIISS